MKRYSVLPSENSKLSHKEIGVCTGFDKKIHVNKMTVPSEYCQESDKQSCPTVGGKNSAVIKKNVLNF